MLAVKLLVSWHVWANAKEKTVENEELSLNLGMLWILIQYRREIIIWWHQIQSTIKPVFPKHLTIKTVDSYKICWKDSFNVTVLPHDYYKGASLGTSFVIFAFFLWRFYSSNEFYSCCRKDLDLTFLYFNVFWLHLIFFFVLFSVFTVIENGTEHFPQPERKPDDLPVRIHLIFLNNTHLALTSVCVNTIVP